MTEWLDAGETARRLAGGGVVLLPTDTLPGLHCRADAQAAVARLCRLKGRDRGKPLLVLCASVSQALALAGPLSREAAAYARRCWPGPYTLVLPRGAGTPSALGGGSTVACRVPAVPELRDLIAAAGGPLVSTSANRAGEPPCRTVAEALACFGAGIDGAWAGWPSRVDEGGGGASALLDLTAWPPRALRDGPLPAPPA